MMPLKMFGALLALAATWCNAATVTLLPTGSTWKYLDNGSDQGTAWRASAFDDSAWKSGPAELGYGDGGEKTIVVDGPAGASTNYITTYFRRSFTVTDANSLTNVLLKVLRDDGAVVYLNGVEVFRSNMPASPTVITHATLALGAIPTTDETNFFQTTVANSALVEGVNVLAVEIHQANATSSDISFDLSLSAERPEMTVSLNAPADNATGVSLSPTLDVAITHRESSTPMTATFHLRALPAQMPADFTIVPLPDTQNYSGSANTAVQAIFAKQTDWILQNRAQKNIVFVTELGDCVNVASIESQWLIATNALYRLETPVPGLLPYGLPYGVAVGNHDQDPQGSATGSTALYNKYFGIAHFTPYKYSLSNPLGYYGGNYGTNNDEHYQLFSAGGMDFIAIHFEYDTAMTVNSPELAWADNLLKQYSNRQAILIAHWFINSGDGGEFGSAGSFSAQGAATYNRLKNNPNVFMMLCGHVNPNGEGKRADTFEGRKVYTLLSDYQDRPNGGDGWMRIMEFSPAKSEIRVRTYSPHRNEFETDANSQFELHWDMLAKQGYTFASYPVTVNGSSPNVTLALSDLPIGTDYEWYVTVTDGFSTVTSPRWHFRTADMTRPAAPGNLAGTALSSSKVELTWTDTSGDAAGFVVYWEKNGAFEELSTIAPPPRLTVTGLMPDTEYRFHVRSFNGAGVSDPSPNVTVRTSPLPPAPSAPATLTVGLVEYNSITLQWPDVEGETGYRLERSTAGGEFTFVASASSNEAQYADGTVSPNVEYQYRIAATNEGGTSPFTVSAPVTTAFPPLLPAPTGVAAQNGESRITITWQPVPGALRYYVYRLDIDGTFKRLFQSYDEEITGTSVVHTNPPLFETSQYRVTAEDGYGRESEPSLTVSAVAYTPPAMPADFVAGDPSATTLGLAWTESTDAIGYRLERSVDGVSFQFVTDLPHGWPFYTDADLSPNTTYHYRLMAKNAYANSVPAEASATTDPETPAIPTGLAADAASGQAVLTWNTAQWAATYDVFRDGEAAPAVNVDTTSWTDALNTADVSYQVRGVNAIGVVGGLSAAVILPAAPSGLSVIARTASSITLSWADNSQAAPEFTIEVSTDGLTFAAGVTVTTTSATVDNLTSATTYHFRVRAVKGFGRSAYSVPASGTTLDVPPSAPTNFRVTGSTTTSISLAWDDTASNETGFNVEQSTANGFTIVATLGANVTSVTVGSLQPGTSYTFRLQAVNAIGGSAFVAVTGATLQGTPDVPTGLTATAGDRRVNLSWNASPTATSYNVKRSTSAAGPFVVIGTATTTTYVDTSVANGSTYHYVVSAESSGGESANSSSVSAMPQAPPAAPSNLQLAVRSSTQIDLSWRDNSNNETGFLIERGTSSSGPFTTYTVGPNVRTYSDTGLLRNTTYWYRVRAFNSAGSSAYVSGSKKTSR